MDVPLIAFLAAPFLVDAPVSNVFDHAPGEDGALAFTGQRVAGKDRHPAYDFRMPTGTPLLAMADGVVMVAGDVGPVGCPDGHRVQVANRIRIRHVGPDGTAYVSSYSHLDTFAVQAGDTVHMGDVIGFSGNTGCSTGPHLHLAVGVMLDPVLGRALPVDPYGWSGPGTDPFAADGRQAGRWLWLDGQAPPLQQVTSQRRATAVPLDILRGVGTDLLRPVEGEWVEVGLRKDVNGRASLSGLTLTNEAGDRLGLPALTLAPGDRIRIWTREEANAGDAVFWHLDHEAFDDSGDCARLEDRAGRVVAALKLGADPPRRCAPDSATLRRQEVP